MNEQFSQRIHAGLQTAQAWDADPTLLSECRLYIPFELLSSEHLSYSSNTTFEGQKNEKSYFRPDDDNYEGDDLFLKRLTVFFQDMMTWVNNPPCSICGQKDTKCIGVRGPKSHEEHEGCASRVEVYHCPDCNASTTTFPRYNSPRKLLETRKGRCGEYANLFGLFCRASGFETRYILDFTDHVWVEVWSNRLGRWIMADACEGKIDVPSMYEKGWGKKLNYILGITHDSVSDVTKRYTRFFHSEEFLSRRRIICNSEIQSEAIIAQINNSLKSHAPKSRISFLERRVEEENFYFQRIASSNTWDDTDYNVGRLSGSLAWRLAREEIKERNDTCLDASKSTAPSANFYHVNQFFPTPHGANKVIVVVNTPPSTDCLTFPSCLVISGVSCGAGIPGTTSVALIHENNGCILDLCLFETLSDTRAFLEHVPPGRIVVICSDIAKQDFTDSDEDINSYFFEGINISAIKSETVKQFFVYVGQFHHNPDWTVCQYMDPGDSVGVEIETSFTDRQSLQLMTEDETIPNRIHMRLPDKFLSLNAQLVASENDKKAAFLQFIQNEEVSKKFSYIGYTTKIGAPVYVITTDGFPFTRFSYKGRIDQSWKTYHFLPHWLFPKSENESLTKVNSSTQIVNDGNVHSFERTSPQTKSVIKGIIIGNKYLSKICKDKLPLEKKHVIEVLIIAKKYLDNVKQSPWNPRFRHIRVSNKFFDKITSNAFGIDLIESIGFNVFCSNEDFVASIPIAADLDDIERRIAHLMT